MNTATPCDWDRMMPDGRHFNCDLTMDHDGHHHDASLSISTACHPGIDETARDHDAEALADLGDVGDLRWDTDFNTQTHTERHDR